MHHLTGKQPPPPPAAAAAAKITLPVEAVDTVSRGECDEVIDSAVNLPTQQTMKGSVEEQRQEDCI
jgi:hypothetical protein